MASEYEKLRLKNLEDNKKILAQLGLSNPFTPLGRVIHKPVKRKSTSVVHKPVKKAVKEDLENYGSVRSGRRRSRRLQGKEAPDKNDITSEIEEDNDDEDEPSYIKVQPGRENFFGVVEGVEVGTIWQTRLQCCAAGVHRPTVAGIHGSNVGAYSIALSGGYEDDVDLGDCFTYTGEGGRDLKGTKTNPKNLRTAAQSKDQTLTRGNLALSRNVELGNPVRVIRGYKLRSPFAPAEGYRYDGLYTVEKYWFTTGLSGFGVWKFVLQRMKNQSPPPWTILDEYNQKKIVKPCLATLTKYSNTLKSRGKHSEQCYEIFTSAVRYGEIMNGNGDSYSDTEKKSQTEIHSTNFQRSDSGIESDASSQKSNDGTEIEPCFL